MRAKSNTTTSPSEHLVKNIRYWQADGMQRAEQRRLSIDIGIAQAAHARGCEFQNKVVEASSSRVDDSEAEGQASMARFHDREVLRAGTIAEGADGECLQCS